ncbi:MAG: lipid-A-disaccharide synthase [Bacteroidia bacterium]|nr:lipid-A-disaccharide synthase [Bacteroidia bacterium]
MKYYIIAGEASGDLHGSNLMKGLFAEDSKADIRFWGGGLMAAVGGTLVRDYAEGAVMGVTDVLLKARKLLKNIEFCKKDIAAWRPDAVILIDYPGFNLKIAKFAHGLGLKVFWYIAPKTWASREGRNRKLKQWVDRLFIIFPFEVPYFESAGVKFTYVGNPLVDAVDQYRYAPVTSSAGGYVALLPGSRKGEIRRMMPVCMKVADRLGRRVVIAGAPSRTMEDYSKYIGGRKNVEVVFGRTYDVLRYADAAIINSGTASLEAALIGTPQVVCWSTSFVSAVIIGVFLQVLKRVKYISLGNLILGRGAWKELIQFDFTPDKVYAEVSRLLSDARYRSRMLSDYAEIRERLGGEGASRAVARAMISELK